MADGPTKTDIDAIFKRLRSSPANKQCFDCAALNPTWASVTYGVFLCMDCSAVHRSLGVHLTFIRSTQLDTTWTWMQLRAMQIGGNANASAFFRQHGCTTNDAQQKYNSRAATMYREKLRSSANKAMQTYGTKLHIDAAQQDTQAQSPKEKEVDFFKEHQEAKLSTGPVASDPIPAATNGAKHIPVADIDPTSGPSVEAALSTSPTQAIQEPRKPTIGARKPASAKKTKGLGARKGGLGAQKVKANFNDIEKEAQARDRSREEEAASAAAKVVQTKEDEEKKMASVRLAYKDLSLESKRQDEKMKKMDPKKRQQMERLGMGMLGGGGTVSHSSLNDMKTIDQESPNMDRERNTFGSRNRDFEDDFEFIGGFSSGPPKTSSKETENGYNDSPFGLKKEDRYSNWGSSKSSAWESGDKFDNKPSVIEDIPFAKDDDRSGRSRKNYDTPTTDEAQQKFGSAKAISSDQFFHKDSDFEHRQNLSKFEGKSSISSAEYFGNGPASAGNRNQYGGSGTGPDLAEIKEGVRQGVTKVAGKLSSLANGVMSSIQDHYG